MNECECWKFQLIGPGTNCGTCYFPPDKCICHKGMNLVIPLLCDECRQPWKFCRCMDDLFEENPDG